MVYPRLTINHNHGTLILRDVVIEDGYAIGTIERGHSTSRLFWATSTHRETPGGEGRWPLYGREPRQVYSRGRSEDGAWVEHPTPGEFWVDCCWCG